MDYLSSESLSDSDSASNFRASSNIFRRLTLSSSSSTSSNNRFSPCSPRSLSSSLDTMAPAFPDFRADSASAARSSARRSRWPTSFSDVCPSCRSFSFVWAGRERAWNARVGAWLLSRPRAGSKVGLHHPLARYCLSNRVNAPVSCCHRSAARLEMVLDEIRGHQP